MTPASPRRRAPATAPEPPEAAPQEDAPQAETVDLETGEVLDAPHPLTITLAASSNGPIDDALTEAEYLGVPATTIGTLQITGTARQRALLFAAMASVLGEIHRVPKAGINAHFNYRFATESDVMDVVRPAMARAGLCILPSVETIDLGDGAKIVTGVLSVTFAHAAGATATTLWHGFTRASGDKDDKQVWKLYTGAMKYVVLKTFMVPTGDEPEADGQGADERPARRQRSRARSTEDAEPAPVELASEFQKATLRVLAKDPHVPEEDAQRILARLDRLTAERAQDAEAYLRRTIAEHGGNPAVASAPVDTRTPGPLDPDADELPLGDAPTEPEPLPPEAGEVLITPKQAARVHALAARAGWNEAWLKLYLVDTIGSEHATDCAAADYGDVTANLDDPATRDYYADRYDSLVAEAAGASGAPASA